MMVRAIREENDSKPGGGEALFTPSRATEMLPLVKSIVADMVRLNDSIAAGREQLKGIDQLPETIEHVDYQEELSDIRASVAADEERLQECLSELAALGIAAHIPIDGTIDFPAVMNRRQVCLCWHPDDAQVCFWHEKGESPKDRRPVDAAAFGVESLN